MSEVVYNLPFEEYHARDCLSQSALKKIKRSPAHYKADIEDEEESTDAQLIGSAVHCLVLESQEFNRRYIFMPEDMVRRGKAWEEFERSNKGKSILPAKVKDDIFGMAKSVVTQPVFMALRDELVTEVSLFWEDAEEKVPCKGRLDAYHKANKTIIDLKTTQDASAYSFAATVFKNGYHSQGAFYLDAARECGLEAAHYLLFAVEKKRPYACAVYRLVDEVVSLARAENRELLKRYKYCTTNNHWPGYPEMVQDIGVPAWGLKQMEN